MSCLRFPYIVCEDCYPEEYESATLDGIVYVTCDGYLTGNCKGRWDWFGCAACSYNDGYQCWNQWNEEKEKK